MQEKSAKWNAVCYGSSKRSRLRNRKMLAEKKITRKRSFEKTNPIWQRRGNNNGSHAKPQGRKGQQSCKVKNAVFRSLRLCAFA
jgi:hypothetical protein